MSDQNSVKGTKKLTTANTVTNATSFLVEQLINSRVNTAEVVAVDSADQPGTGASAGYAAATPLVCPVDGYNSALPPTCIPKLPFFRPQAGKAAIVMDPQPGDKAVLIAMKRDSSGVAAGKNEPVQPGSFRTFDQSDGYLINGFLGEKPEIWLHLNPVSGDISLSTKAAKIDISCREAGDIDIKTAGGNVSLSASTAITLTAPDICLNGNLRVSSPDGAIFTGRTFSVNAGVVNLNEGCE